MARISPTPPPKNPNQMASIKAVKTRQSIIDAAKAIILEEGIGALTMDHAAEKAGISKGALMYHFKSKRALQAALVEDYAAHLDAELSRHEALFDGSPEETLVPGFIEWFRSFDRDNHGWASVGLAIHSNFVHDEELMRPVKAWYEKLHARIAALPEDVRTPALVAIMALEGFFYSHKFGVDLTNPKLKIQAWHYILDNLVNSTAVKPRAP